MSQIYEDMNVAYPAIKDLVENKGFWCNPRGQVCRELRPATFDLNRPDRALYTGIDRKLNYSFYAIECLLYIAGKQDTAHAKLLASTNRNMQAFINQKTGMFDGAYGPRMKDGLQKCFELLSADLWTRQAVVSIWNNVESRTGHTVDVPCTLSLQFYATPYGEHEFETQLNMSATMRSNDINWGLPYDVAAFCEIQCLMASALNMKVGRYTHNVGSLHFYRDSPPPDMMTDGKYTVVDQSVVPLAYEATNSKSWSQIMCKADLLIERAVSCNWNSRLSEFQYKETDDPWINRMQKLIAFSWSSYNKAIKDMENV